jgi:hypothetical protein
LPAVPRPGNGAGTFFVGLGDGLEPPTVALGDGLGVETGVELGAGVDVGAGVLLGDGVAVDFGVDLGDGVEDAIGVGDGLEVGFGVVVGCGVAVAVAVGLGGGVANFFACEPPTVALGEGVGDAETLLQTAIARQTDTAAFAKPKLARGDIFFPLFAQRRETVASFVPRDKWRKCVPGTIT